MTDNVLLIDLQKEFGFTKAGLYAKMERARQVYSRRFKARHVLVPGHKNKVAVISRADADKLREFHRVAGRNR